MENTASPLKRTLPVVAVLAMAASYSVFFLQRDTVYRLGREDGLFEDLSAICFFAAAALFAVAFWRSRGTGDDTRIARKRRNIWFLLLALLFFFGGGEEISWGQRIFGWETPDTFEKANIQRETNIHNLKLFNRNDENWQGKTGAAEFLSAERLFSLFWLGFCIGVPVMYALVRPFRRLMHRVGMPIVPLALGVLFIVNYATAEVLKRHALRLDLQWPLMEIKECLFSVLFLLIAVYFAVGQRGAQPVAATQPAGAAAAPLHDDDDELAHVAT
jgi:hypothetical protein